MPTRAIRLSIASAVAVGTLLAAGGSASAVGEGTFTKITHPSRTTTFDFDGHDPSHNHLVISGETSADVTTVDIDCISVGAAGPSVLPLATGVPVASEAFSTVAPLSLTLNCRLRAVPSGVDPHSDYLGSYAGPILYTSGANYDSTGTTIYGYTALGEEGDGTAIALDAAECGPANSVTVEPPAMQTVGAGSEACAFALPSANVTGGAATGSAIKVGGHNAYLPYSVHTFLNAPPQSLGLPQPPLATTLTRSGNGDVTITESAVLKRCSVDDTYPPTPASCPSLVNAGVKFARTLNLFRGDHQIRVRDAFSSTDGQAHTINLQYRETVSSPNTGAVGYMFPGAGAAFHQTSLNQVVTGLGARAGTMFVRSDLHSVEGDPAADTLGLTWSRAPQKVQFSGGTEDLFALPYALTVAANRATHLGFAYSRRSETRDARSLAAIAVNEMVNPPSVGSPSNAAVIKGHTTTVNGSVTLGANGLPSKVLVNGHPAHLTSLSANRETYSAAFSESFGKHTIRVIAEDVAGNTSSESLSVTNVAP